MSGLMGLIYSYDGDTTGAWRQVPQPAKPASGFQALTALGKILTGAQAKALP